MIKIDGLLKTTDQLEQQHGRKLQFIHWKHRVEISKYTSGLIWMLTKTKKKQALNFLISELITEVSYWAIGEDHEHPEVYWYFIMCYASNIVKQ